MRVARLVLGIIGIVLAVIMFFAGIAGMFQLSINYTSVTGYGLFIAPIFLAGGIVMTACNKKGILGGCIACAILYLACGVLGMAGQSTGDFTSGWLTVIIIYFLFSIAGIIVNVTTSR